MGTFLDLNTGDLCFTSSDQTAMSTDGDLMMRTGENMAMDSASGDMHLISSLETGNTDNNNL